MKINQNNKKLKKVFIGIDMGGTLIKIALLGREGQILRCGNLKAKSDLSLELRLKDLVDEINFLLGSEFSLLGIGIAFPGIIDFTNRKIISQYVKYPGAHSADIIGWAHKNWNVPVIMENDARAALVGEWQYGSGKGSNNLVMITLGTGMGSAVLIEGELLRGKNFLAGNLGGHMAIDFEGDFCNCGNRGCVETAGSTWALRKNLHKISGYEHSSLANEKELDYKKVFEAANQNDTVAQVLRTRSLEAWSAAIINLLHAYDPELVIIGGGIMDSKDQIIPFLEQRVKERSWLPDTGVPIVAAEQTKHAGILGIYYLLKNIVP